MRLNTFFPERSSKCYLENPVFKKRENEVLLNHVRIHRDEGDQKI